MTRFRIGFVSSNLAQLGPLEQQFRILNWEIDRFAAVQSFTKSYREHPFDAICLSLLRMEDIDILNGGLPSPEILKQLCICVSNMEMAARKYLDDHNIRMVKFDVPPPRQDQLIRGIRSKFPRFVRAVVADDLPMVRLQIKTLLKDFGFQIVGEAANGVETLEVCREQKPDLLTLDISMPQKSGLESFRDLREVSPGTEVIMVTGQRTKEAVMLAAQLGVRHFVAKPIIRQNLSEMILKAVF